MPRRPGPLQLLFLLVTLLALGGLASFEGPRDEPESSRGLSPPSPGAGVAASASSAPRAPLALPLATRPSPKVSPVRSSSPWALGAPRVELVQPALLEGRVEDAAGNPVSEALVRLELWVGTQRRDLSQRSDAAGRFRFEGIEGRRVVGAGGNGVGSEAQVEAPRGEVSASVERYGAGRGFASQGVSPGAETQGEVLLVIAPRFDLTLSFNEPISHGYLKWTFAEQEGDFQGGWAGTAKLQHVLPNLRPGRYRIAVRAEVPGSNPPELRWGEAEVLLTEGHAEVPLVLSKLGRVQVRLLDPSGVALAGEVGVVPGDSKFTHWHPSELQPSLRRAVFDFGGQELPQAIQVGIRGESLVLPPGRWRLIATSADRNLTRAEAALDVLPGQEAVAELRLARSEVVEVLLPEARIAGEDLACGISLRGPPGVSLTRGKGSASLLIRGLKPEDRVLLLVALYDLGERTEPEEIADRSGVFSGLLGPGRHVPSFEAPGAFECRLQGALEGRFPHLRLVRAGGSEGYRLSVDFSELDPDAGEPSPSPRVALASWNGLRDAIDPIELEVDGAKHSAAELHPGAYVLKVWNGYPGFPGSRFLLSKPVIVRPGRRTRLTLELP